ncbi:hypothetical protein ELH51_26805 [Rhizobium ruizarguesonis]|nr:hypothetical protein ELH51_26805 [Rhizobium ruizarguesonis]
MAAKYACQKQAGKRSTGFGVKTLQPERRNGSLDSTSVNDAGDLALKAHALRRLEGKCRPDEIGPTSPSIIAVAIEDGRHL